MSKIYKTISHHKLLLIVGLIVIVIFVAVIFYAPQSEEKVVASGILAISKDAAATLFSYSGTGVNQSMDAACNIPASMKITCQSFANQGAITVYINDESYATGTVTSTGEVALSSGCGCSTVCICEIKIGENNIKISSNNFVGQLMYEIYVKS